MTLQSTEYLAHSKCSFSMGYDSGEEEEEDENRQDEQEADTRGN